MNNTESKFNGMNNVISRKKRHNPLIVFPDLSVLSKPESAAELSGSGNEEKVEEDSAKHSHELAELLPEPAAEVTAPINPEPQVKTSSISFDVVSAEADYILSKKEEDEIASNTRAAINDKIATAARLTKAALPVKKTKGKMNPFLIATD
jgi:hypothetical protein